MVGFVNPSNAAAVSAIKSDKICWAYAIGQEQLKVPFNAFCWNQKTNEVYFYDKFSLRAKEPAKTPTRVEAVMQFHKLLETDLSQSEMAYPYEIDALFILTDKNSMIYINKYNYDFEGELHIGNTKYQYQRYQEIE
jgi:hypothetical protein